MPATVSTEKVQPWTNTQVGPDQAGFFDFYSTKVLPRFPSSAG